MCKMKSAIILKDRVFIPDYDSHSDMLEELKIADTRANAERVFVRAELSPSDGDVFSDINTWAFNVDQDIRPDWFVEEVEKARMVEAVKVWAKDHIHIGGDGLKIDSGSNHYIKDCKDVVICGNSTIKYVYGNSTIKNVCGNSTIKNVYGNSTIEYVYGNSTIKNVYGNSTIKNVYGNSTIEYVYENSTIKNVCGNSTIKNVCENSTIEYVCENSTIKNVCENSTIEYVYGNSTIKNVYGNSTIKNVYGNSTIEYVYENSTIEYVCGNSTIKNVCGNSTIKNVCENSTIIGSPYVWKNKDKFILSDNATFKDREAKIIYQSGNRELRLVGKDGKING